MKRLLPILFLLCASAHGQTVYTANSAATSTFTGNATSGSKIITSSGTVTGTPLYLKEVINSGSFPANSFITNLSPLTLSQNATGTASGVAFTGTTLVPVTPTGYGMPPENYFALFPYDNLLATQGSLQGVRRNQIEIVTTTITSSFTGNLNSSTTLALTSPTPNLTFFFAVSGSGIPNGDYVTAINTPIYTGNTTSGSTSVTALSSTANLLPGQSITGIGIPVNDTIATVGAGTLTLAVAATANGTAVNLSVSTSLTLNVAATSTSTGVSFSAGNNTLYSYQNQSGYDQITLNAKAGWASKVIAHNNNTNATITGAPYGSTATITGNSGSGSGTPPITYVNTAFSAVPGNGDLIEVSPPALLAPPQAGLNRNTNNWDVSGGGSSAYDTVSGNQPPAVAGLPQTPGVLQLVCPATITTYLDSAADQNVIMLGTVPMSINAKVISGTPTLTMNAQRTGGATFVSNSQAMSGTWTTYSATGTGSETPQNAGVNASIVVSYGCTGTGTIDLTSAYLGGEATNGGNYTHTNGSPFSDNYITYLQQSNGDELRVNYVSGAQDVKAGANLVDLLQPVGVRPQANVSDKNYTGFNGIMVGLHDTLVAAQKAGLHRVEYALPPTLSAAELAIVGDYLNGGCGTVGGGYRCGLGQTAPWNTVFTSITLAVGNEMWNSSVTGEFSGGAPFYATMGLAIQFCAAIKANSNWNPAIDHCAVTLQPTNGNNLRAQDPTGSGPDRIDSSFYSIMDTSTSCAMPGVINNLFAEAQGASDNSANQWYTVGSQAFPISGYEGGGNALGGVCTTGQTTGLFRGLGGAIYDAVMDGYLKTWPAVFPEQNRWDLGGEGPTTGYNPTGSGTATTVDLWAVRPNMRGEGANNGANYYAYQLHNIGMKLGNMIRSTVASQPTLAVATGNNIPGETLNQTPCWFYTDGATNRVYECWNLDSSSHTVTLPTGTDAITGTVTQTIFSDHSGSVALNHNNDTLNSTAVIYNDVSTVSAPASLTLAPYTGVALQGSTTTGPSLYTVLP